MEYICYLYAYTCLNETLGYSFLLESKSMGKCYCLSCCALVSKGPIFMKSHNNKNSPKSKLFLILAANAVMQ